MTSSILRICRTSWQASKSCCFFEMRGSKTNCSFMSTSTISERDQYLRSDERMKERMELTVVTSSSAIDTQSRVTFVNLSTLDLCERLNRCQSRVLRQCEWDRVQSSREGPHSVLFDRGDLVCRFGYRDRTGDFGSSSSVHDSVVSNQGSHDT